MFTPDERRALLFLVAVAACGALVRIVRSAGISDAPGAALIAPEITGGDIARQAAAARAEAELARPLRPGETVDLDAAGSREIERLPRVGKELAERIVAERASNGPFGSLEGLGRVPGIGPATLRLFEGKVRFSGTAREPPRRESAFGVRESSSDRAASSDSRSPIPGSRCPPPPISLNTATADQLACLPGIGPGLAARIVTFRTARGPFPEVKALQQVPGIGPARMARLAPLLAAP